MSQTLVSVIIPTFNYGHFIIEAIESVLAQTYTNYEIIVVDDGSRDGTEERLRLYLGRIVYIHQENQGLSTARNTGIAAARGDWVAFLDSDDMWHPQKLEVQMAYIAANPNVDLLASAHDSSSEPSQDPVNVSSRIIKHISLKDILKKSRFGPSGVIARRICFEEIGGFDQTLRSAEDRDMWIRFAKQGRVELLSSVLWWYRVHGMSMSHNPSRMEENEDRVLRKAFDGDKPSWLRQQSFSYAAYSATYMYHISGLHMLAFRRMIRSIYLWPLPYTRADVWTSFARPKLFLIVSYHMLKSIIILIYIKKLPPVPLSNDDSISPHTVQK